MWETFSTEEIMSIGMTDRLALSTRIAICSIVLRKLMIISAAYLGK